ncbi:hypothetical protein L7F22_059624 [Adiantum nelumboides]|nr:hypothetical protein [Adiantum nelumboides]
MSMVRTLAESQHRLLLFLQQSSVEWCSSLWLDFIRSVDPSLCRTIIVISKFDNRLKEFGERWEVDRYFECWRILRRDCTSILCGITKRQEDNIKGGFDEEKFGDYIGFSNLKQYLELELQRRYKDAAAATLAVLEERCSQVAKELSKLNDNIVAASDIASLRRAAMVHASSIARHVVFSKMELLSWIHQNGGKPVKKKEQRVGWANFCGTSKPAVGGYVPFHTSLRCAYNQFVRNLASRCDELTRHHLEALTSPFSHMVLSAPSKILTGHYLT